MSAIPPLALLAASALHAGAAVTAWRLSRPHLLPYYRPIAHFLAWSLLTEIVRWVNRVWVLAGAVRPLEGWARVAGHGEQALALAWPAGVAAVAWWAFVRPPHRGQRGGLAAVALGYLGALGWLVTHYPAIRGERLQVFYQGFHRWSVVAGIFAVIVHHVQSARAPSWPQLPQRVAVILLAIEVLAEVAGPYAWHASLFDDADLGVVIYSALYGILMYVHWRTQCSTPNTGRRTALFSSSSD